MKRKTIEIVKEILYTFMNHWVIMMLAVTVMGLFGKEETGIGLWLAMWVVPLCLYFARAFVGNFFLFFLIHLIWPAIVVLSPVALLEKVLMMAIVLIYMVWSLKIRLTEKNGKDDSLFVSPVFSICVLGVLALMENFLCKKGWQNYYVAAILIYLGCYFVHHFIAEYLRFLRVNESSATNIPEREIFFSGLKQTLLFAGICLVVLLLTANIEWLASILSVVGRGLKALLTWLLSGEMEYSETTVTQTMEQMQGNMMDGMSEDTEPFFIWVLLEKIVLFLVPIAIIALVVFSAVSIFRFLWRRFHEERVREEKKVQDSRDVREALVIESEKKDRAGLFSFLNNRQKVRKLYKKRVLKSKEDIIGALNTEDLEYMTARECCDKIAAENLKKVYEKARYSDAEITAEDIKLLKSAEK